MLAELLHRSLWRRRRAELIQRFAEEPACVDEAARWRAPHRYVAVPSSADDSQALESLCRHVTARRWPNEQFPCNAAGQEEFRLKTPWRDGTTHLVMSPEFCSAWRLGATAKATPEPAPATLVGRLGLQDRALCRSRLPARARAHAHHTGTPTVDLRARRCPPRPGITGRRRPDAAPPARIAIAPVGPDGRLAP